MVSAGIPGTTRPWPPSPDWSPSALHNVCSVPTRRFSSCRGLRTCCWQGRGGAIGCPTRLQPARPVSRLRAGITSTRIDPDAGWYSRPVELVALDRQRADALAHLVADTFITGVVDAAVDSRESGLLAEIPPFGRILWIHVAD